MVSKLLNKNLITKVGVAVLLTVTLLIIVSVNLAFGQSFLTKWGTFGSNPGQFKYPQGLALDSAGNVYVADVLNYRIQKFDPSGNFITSWGSYGSAPGQFNPPRGVHVAGSFVYVADAENYRIQKFDLNGNFLLQWGSCGTANGQFSPAFPPYANGTCPGAGGPEDVATDSAGNVYVADRYGARIQKFDSNGIWLLSWTVTGGAPDPLANSVTLDSNDNVYVAESASRKILKYSSAGTFIQEWLMFVTGSGTPYPLGVETDGNNNVFATGALGDLCATCTHEVQKFSSSGAYLGSFGVKGTGDGQFYNPWGIDISSQGKVYIADHVNSRIQVFASPASSDFAWIRQFGTNELDKAEDVFRHSTGVYVVGSTRGNLAGFVGGEDIFVRKYDSDGNALWTRQFGTTDYQDVGYGAFVDSTGVYVVGSTGQGALPGQTSQGSGDAFIRKYDHAGNELWTKQSGTNLWDSARGVHGDSTGIYVVGLTQGTFAGQTSSGGSDAFIAKFDPTNGNQLWLKQFGTSGINDSAHGVFVDSTGVYVSGQVQGALPGQIQVGPSDSVNAFVRKYNFDGVEQFTKQFAGLEGAFVQAGAFGVSGNSSGVYVVGMTIGALPGQTNTGTADVFIRKYDSSGNEQWTKQFGSVGGTYDEALDVSTNAAGVYVAGHVFGGLPGQTYLGDRDAFIREYDNSGNEVFTKQFGSTQEDIARGVSVGAGDSVIEIYSAGSTRGALPGQAFSGGIMDAFLVKLTETPPAPPPSSPAVDGNIWVVNAGNDNVSKISSQTNAVVNVIPTVEAGFTRFDSMAADPQWVWLSHGFLPGKVTRIAKLSNSVVQELDIGGIPEHLVVDATHIWIADPVFNKIRKINKFTNEIQDIAVSKSPLAVAADDTSVWAMIDGDNVLRIDKTAGAVVATIPTGGLGSGSIALDNDYVYLTKFHSREVRKISKATNVVVASLAFVDPQRLAGIAVDKEASGSVWVADNNSNVVYRLNKDLTAILATITVGSNPTAIALDNSRVYVANSYAGSQNGTISVIDKATNSVVATVPVGHFPMAAATGYEFDKFFTQVVDADNDGIYDKQADGVTDFDTQAGTASGNAALGNAQLSKDNTNPGLVLWHVPGSNKVAATALSIGGIVTLTCPNEDPLALPLTVGDTVYAECGSALAYVIAGDGVTALYKGNTYDMPNTSVVKFTKTSVINQGATTIIVNGSVSIPPSASPYTFSLWSAKTSGITQGLYDVDFVNETLGYAVGYGSAIIKTTDGGNTWAVQSSPLGPTEHFFSVDFVDANIGYAVGTSGNVLKTANGGATWVQQTSGTGNPLYRVHFPFNANTGYIVGNGGTLLKTTNGGATWVPQSTPYGNAIAFQSISFPDGANPNVGYVGGSNNSSDIDILLKTTDGGATWTALTPNIPGWSGVETMQFVNTQVGFAGGLTWDPPTAVDGTGFISKTIDGGATWTHKLFAVWDWPEDIELVNADIVYVTGTHYADANDSVGSKLMLKTYNGGSTWSYEILPTSAALGGIEFPTANVSYAVGKGGAVLKYSGPPVSDTDNDGVNNLKMDGVSAFDAQIGTASNKGVEGLITLEKFQSDGVTPNTSPGLAIADSEGTNRAIAKALTVGGRIKQSCQQSGGPLVVDYTLTIGDEIVLECNSGDVSVTETGSDGVVSFGYAGAEGNLSKGGKLSASTDANGNATIVNTGLLAFDIIFNSQTQTVAPGQQIALQQAAQCVASPAGLVSWWPLDETSGTTATDIIDGNPGTLVNGPVWTSAGKVNGALSFDGANDYVNVPHNVNLDPGTGPFTVDTWIKTTMSSGRQAVAAKYECGGSCPANVANSVYVLYTFDGKLEAVLRDTAGTSQTLTGSTPVADGNFHHVAMVRDTAGGQLRLYVDGALDASAALTVIGAIKDDDGEADPLTVGAVFVGGSSSKQLFFSGTIDEVEFFNRALTVSEIQAIYAAGGAGKCKPQPAVCGNSVKETGEDCDDGNTISGDGCSAICGNEICTPLSSGVTHWWPGDVDGRDIAGNNPAVFEGGATAGTPGKVAGAFRFDGIDDGLNLGNVPGFDFTSTSGFSLEAWINMFGATGQAWQNIISTNYACAAEIVNLVISTAGILSFSLRDANGISVSVTSPSPISTNVFHYVVATREVVGTSKTLKLYVDGTLVATAPDLTTGSFARNTADFIGRQYPCPYTYPFNGLIDEVTAYDRPLTAAEVAANYSAGSAGKCVAPIQVCGNNIKEGTEVCDGIDLGGQTCVTQGFTGGILDCNLTCTALETRACFLDTTLPPVPVLNLPMKQTPYQIIYVDSTTPPQTGITTKSIPFNISNPKLDWSDVVDMDNNGNPTTGVKYDSQISMSQNFDDPNVVKERDARGLAVSEYVPVPPLLDGKYFMRVRAKDAAGNVGGWSPAEKFVIDTTPPTVALSMKTPTNSLTLNATVRDSNFGDDMLRVAASASPTLNIFKCPSIGINPLDTDELMFNNFILSEDFVDSLGSSLADGIYNFTGKYTGAATNIGSSAVVPVTVDRIAPTVSIINPQVNGVVSGITTVQVDITDERSGVDPTSAIADVLDQETNTLLQILTLTESVSGSGRFEAALDTTTLPNPDKAKTLKVFAKDNASNSFTASVNFRIANFSLKPIAGTPSTGERGGTRVTLTTTTSGSMGMNSPVQPNIADGNLNQQLGRLAGRASPIAVYDSDYRMEFVNPQNLALDLLATNNSILMSATAGAYALTYGNGSYTLLKGFESDPVWADSNAQSVVEAGMVKATAPLTSIANHVNYALAKRPNVRVYVAALTRDVTTNKVNRVPEVDAKVKVYDLNQLKTTPCLDGKTYNASSNPADINANCENLVKHIGYTIQSELKLAYGQIDFALTPADYYFVSVTKDGFKGGRLATVGSFDSPATPKDVNMQYIKTSNAKTGAKQTTFTGSQFDLYSPESIDIPAGVTVSVPWVGETSDLSWTWEQSFGSVPAGCAVSPATQSATLSNDGTLQMVALSFDITCSANTTISFWDKIRGLLLPSATAQSSHSRKEFGVSHRLTDNTATGKGRVHQLDERLPARVFETPAGDKAKGNPFQ